MRPTFLALGAAVLASTTARAVDINRGAPLVDTGDQQLGPGSSAMFGFRWMRVGLTGRFFMNCSAGDLVGAT
jgi:hypothetical protein